MEKQILFSEKQNFRKWWLWLFLFALNGTILYAVYIQIITGHPFGDKPMSDTGIFIALGMTLLLTFFFFIFRLETQINKDGIYVRFFPFHISFRFHPWNTISKSYVRQYKPILEYGGWGLRGMGKNKALNVSGNMGLQLEFTDNRRLLIGTQLPEELSAVLYTIGQNKAE